MAQMSQGDGIEIDQFEGVDQTFLELLTRLETIEKQKKELTEKNFSLENKINKIVDKLDSVLERQTLLEKCILDTNKQFEFIVKQITTQRNPTLPPEPAQPPTRKQTTFAEIIKTGPTHPSKPTTFPLPNKPPKAEKPTLPNRFKKFGNPLEIINAINGALLKVNAKTDNTPVQIKAVTRFSSGDLRLLTRTKTEAKWLLINRNTWAHLADPNRIPHPSTLFPHSLRCRRRKNCKQTPQTEQIGQIPNP
ncbi:hypothetical protein O181_061677 [Austropuccinia psidii MF-1]|uniref:Uncharacterized protein n=1 Tax=Austropuccinia psidii MF-1 TaxID=1389203 RepID=A0A9Q3EL60_9BASI|nr:hypothetical protein [Austropuccinia psidii MF-1]